MSFCVLSGDWGREMVFLTSRYIKAVLIAAALFAAAPPVFAQGRKPAARQQQIPIDEVNPQVAFARFEGAWKRADAEMISRMTGSNKVFVQMKGVADSGEFYSRSQIFFMLKNLFRENQQIKFEFVKYHNLDSADRKVYAIAYRNYKNIRSEKVFQDKVYVTLCREGKEWVLAEIKTTR